MIRHKKLFATICLTATVVFAATASMQTTEPEKHEWKNLKVLPKNISEKDLDKVMDEWRDALGVRCGFCHARDAATNKNDFASDAKPEKNMAREMMRMTQKINKKYFKADKDGKESKDMTAAITCYVCHHGNAHPESVLVKVVRAALVVSARRNNSKHRHRQVRHRRQQRHHQSNLILLNAMSG
jgi:cytochrome c553